MMSLFDEEQIMKSFIRSERHEAAQENARETAKRMIKKGKMSLEEIADYVPALSLEELNKTDEQLSGFLPDLFWAFFLKSGVSCANIQHFCLIAQYYACCMRPPI